MERTNLIVWFFQGCGAFYVLNTAGTGALVCFIAGGVLNMISARVGVNVTVNGQTRLAHALSHELFDALQIGIRTGSIGGLLATSLGRSTRSVSRRTRGSSSFSRAWPCWRRCERS